MGYTASLPAVRAPFVADSSTAGHDPSSEKWLLLQRFQEEGHPRWLISIVYEFIWIYT